MQYLLLMKWQSAAAVAAPAVDYVRLLYGRGCGSRAVFIALPDGYFGNKACITIGYEPTTHGGEAVTSCNTVAQTTVALGSRAELRAVVCTVWLSPVLALLLVVRFV
jgi:hypothetical protein